MSLSTLLIRFGVIILILLLIDYYVFDGIKSMVSGIETEKNKTIIYLAYWGITVAYLILFFLVLIMFDKSVGPRGFAFRLMSGLLVLIWFPKIVVSFFLIGEDFYRLFEGVFNHFSTKPVYPESISSNYFHERRAIVSKIAFSFATIPFLSVLHGITLGKYDYKVHKITLFFENLPKSFDGFTITQISDIHAGSFDDKQSVEKGIKLINEQKSDIVVFTGDLVNNRAEEFYEWIDVFKQIKAPMGKYSIVGNHDYGDYVTWNSLEEKKTNFENLKLNHSKIGFHLLLNENIIISKENENIALVGIENWGIPPFPQKGDVKKATQNLDTNIFKILLSHDPSHWDAEVIKTFKDIPLTLSGHTHGMQFGIEIPGFFKWSPVKFKYPRWAGLYKVAEQFLYVNRGFGFIGFPGRVGIFPEVTKIELKNKS
jgi:uncharacterized protein